MKPTLSKEQIREILLEHGFKLKPQPDGVEDLNPYVYSGIWAVLSAATTEGTPFSHRPQLTEDDEFRELINLERSELPCGEMTDDELANAIFLASRGDLDLIVYQTGAKDRLRWLSRHLAAALEREAALRKELGLDKDPNDTNNGQEIIETE